MILFKSSPSSADDTARVVEFSKAERFAQATNYVPVGGGDSVRLLNNQVVSLIFYPRIVGQTIGAPEEIALLRHTAEQMKLTANQFPSALQPLTAPYRTVQAALAQFDSGKILIAGEWKDKAMVGAPTSGGETLKVKLPDGTEREYTGVRITGETFDSLKITHSGGAATIPYEQLPEELQKQHAFDPVAIAKAREEKAQEAMTSTASTPGIAIPEKPNVTLIRAASDDGINAKWFEKSESAESQTLAKFLSQFETGVSVGTFSSEQFSSMKKFLHEIAPFSSSAGVLEKAKPYMVADPQTTCTVGVPFAIPQDEAYVLPLHDQNGSNFSALIFYEPGLFEGIAFQKLFAVCIGSYFKDLPDGTPVFLGHAVNGLDSSAQKLIVVKLP